MFRDLSLQNEQYCFLNTIFDKINTLYKAKEPFIFLFDFELKKPKVYSLNEVPNGLFYSINGQTNVTFGAKPQGPISLLRKPSSLSSYATKFEQVKSEINYGNTYLLNLTDRSSIHTNSSLRDIFYQSKAPFKLLWDDKFVCFSPEAFIRIRGDKISTFPMKGTISADLPDARNQILTDKKELAEHYTIVDLLRNDLSLVAKEVTVDKFRYIDKIDSPQGGLLQVSSKISGKLKPAFKANPGDIFKRILPAGSVSGAPKKKTLEIIKRVEREDRGYYTGVFGLYDGKTVESAIMIRYIEKKEKQLFYRSGGGITFMSDLNDEYQELIDKIYVPTDRNHTDKKREAAPACTS